MIEDESPNSGADQVRDADPATQRRDPASARVSPAPGLRSRRPAAVTIVAITYIVLSMIWLATSIQALISANILLPPGGGVFDTESLPRGLSLLGGITALRQAAVGLATFVAGIALLRMHPRGWLLGMVASVVVLAVQLVSWYEATPNYIVMAFAVVTVLLMNQAEVRDAFAEEANA